LWSIVGNPACGDDILSAPILYEKGSAHMCHTLSTRNQGYMNRGNQKHKRPKYKVHQEYIDNLRKCKIALCKGLHVFMKDLKY
jgi:hypothetical protein